MSEIKNMTKFEGYQSLGMFIIMSETHFLYVPYLIFIRFLYELQQHINKLRFNNKQVRSSQRKDNIQCHQFKKTKAISEYMQISMYQIEQQPQQIDICFYNSIASMRNNTKFLMGFYIFRLCFVVWYQIVHLQMGQTDNENVYNLVTLLFYIFIIFSIVNIVFSKWTYNTFLNNSHEINKIAERLQYARIIEEHSQQDINSFYKPSELPEINISNKIYQFASNLQISQTDQQYKRRAQRNCTALISHQIEFNQNYKCWNQFFNLCSIAIFVYSIVVLSQGGGITDSQFTFIVIFLVSQSFVRLFIYLVLLFMSLSPLLCLGICIYVCFFKKQQKVELPGAVQATLNIIRECEGQCPICFQNIVQNEKIIVLKCSPKHVFHEICIQGWAKIGKNCPVCRAQI